MSDHEATLVRSSETMIINVLRTRNIKGQRGDAVTISVKVEFGDHILGESTKIEGNVDEATEINYQAKLNVTFEDPLSLDELVSMPVVLTFTETLPKEKKQKEEKPIRLGQCTVDLLPMLEGKTKHDCTLSICPLPGSALENLSPDHPTPEVDVQLSVVEALLSEPLLQDANLLSVTLETMYSPPETWQAGSSAYHYIATLPVPVTAKKDNVVVLTDAALKAAGEKDGGNKQKKWPNPGKAEYNAIYIPEQMIHVDEAIEDEQGEMKTKEEREHRHLAETERLRVTWNQERRCYLNPEANNILEDKIAKTRYWPVEIYRMPNLAGGAKGKKEDDGHISFHGIAYVNMSPLLYPGVNRIRGAYKVVAYRDNELTEKTKRTTSLADESLKIATGILNRGAASPYPKAGKGKDDGKGKDAKKGAPSVKASDAASDADGQMIVNAEGQQYTDAKSYVMIEIMLRRPLVAKKQPEELAKMVAEYIPPRPLYPKRMDGAQKSVEEYHAQIGKVASLVLADFREQFGEEIDGLINTPDAIEQRRQQLLFNLNSSGKYFAFKEQLKHSVVKIVREKYLKTTNFKDKAHLQSFLSELYVFLLDQMHVALNKILSIEDQSPVPEPLTDSAQLKHFAREAEVTGNLELATKYYKERITRDRNDPDHWFDYGTFCLYTENLTEAEECFKECVAIDQRHLYGLLLYGIVSSMQDKPDTAETFLEAAVSLNNSSILAWTMLGLFYHGIGNEIRAEMAFAEANKINLATAVAHAKELKHEEEKKEEERLAEQQKQEREKQSREANQEDQQSNLLPIDEQAQPADITSKDGASVADGASVQTSKQPGQQPVQAATPTSQASDGKKTVKSDRKGSATRRTASRPNSHRPKSGTHGPSTEDQPVEESATPREPTPVPEQSIFMQTMEFLLEVKATSLTERSLGMHLLDPLGGMSAEYHICIARMLLQKHLEEEAEISIKEALALDHKNPDAWALMGHVKYLLNHTEEAKSCYERTLAFVSEPSEMHSIYLRLASMYLLEARFEEAKNTFLLACKRSPSCVSWLGVGMACFRLGELTEAEDALSEANILSNANAEVWAYLSLVCLRNGRKQEAEQAYKFAIKLNLGDEALINEIHQVQQEVGFGNPQL